MYLSVDGNKPISLHLFHCSRFLRPARVGCGLFLNPEPSQQYTVCYCQHYLTHQLLRLFQLRLYLNTTDYDKVRVKSNPNEEQHLNELILVLFGVAS